MVISKANCTRQAPLYVKCSRANIHHYLRPDDTSTRGLTVIYNHVHNLHTHLWVLPGNLIRGDLYTLARCDQQSAGGRNQLAAEEDVGTCRGHSHDPHGAH